VEIQKIKRLAQSEIQKIAAGEVVERPVSVLKELLENALDAGAQTIAIYIEQAGKRLIRVVDDGCGMSRADARMAFEPHATSKIQSVDDLFSIESYGFRGEALASISAVSRMTLITALHGQEDSATLLECDQGIFSPAQTVCAKAGTDLSVRDLFCSVPVRLKFLKKDETEWNQLYDLVQAVAFSSPGISFVLYRDGQLILNAQGVDSLLSRARQLWEVSYSQHLLEFEVDAGLECAVRGVVSRTNIHRYNRSDIFLFVNGRWVKNQSLSKAVLKGYAQSLPDGKFPMAVIFVNIDPARVDVNIHPRKEEVLFVSPGRVEAAIADAVRKALQESVIEKKIDQISQHPEKKISPENIQIQRFEHSFNNPFFEQKTHPERLVFNDFSIRRVVPSVPDSIFVEEKKQQALFELTENSDVQIKLNSWKICAQLFKTYVLIESEGQFLMMDQHAAHERILYERMKGAFESFVGIELLFPQILSFSSRLYEQILESAVFLAQCGISLESFGAGQVKVSSFPVDASRLDMKVFFEELFQEFSVNEKSTELLRKKIYEHVHSHAACKAAIKAGDELTMVEMTQLYLDLQQVENRHMCIHGRPTIWRISKNEIEKQFRRI
jgi:DNA mismatch repair protein MutL